MRARARLGTGPDVEAVDSAGNTGGATTNHTDAWYFTQLDFSKHSHWLRPWRGYTETMPATRFIEDVGYAAVERGRRTLADGTALEADSLSAVDHRWQFVPGGSIRRRPDWRYRHRRPARHRLRQWLYRPGVPSGDADNRWQQSDRASLPEPP